MNYCLNCGAPMDTNPNDQCTKCDDEKYKRETKTQKELYGKKYNPRMANNYNEFIADQQ